RVAGSFDIFRTAVDAAPAAVGPADVAEFGCQKHLVSAVADSAPDQLFVLALAVDVGSVEEIDTEFERPVNGRDRFSVILARVKIRHAHASQAESGDLGAVPAQCALLHL